MIVRIKISITAIVVIEIFIPDFILVGNQNQNLDPTTIYWKRPQSQHNLDSSRGLT